MGLTALPEHLWCPSWDSATSQGPRPAESLPSPRSWQLQSASLFPESDYKGKTHTWNFPEYSQPALVPTVSGTAGLQFPCERKKGPRRAPGRGVALRLSKGASGAGCCDTGSKSYPVGVQDTESQPRPHCRPPHQGTLQSAGPAGHRSLHLGVHGRPLSAFPRLRRSGCVFLSNIFSKEQYLFW